MDGKGGGQVVNWCVIGYLYLKHDWLLSPAYMRNVANHRMFLAAMQVPVNSKQNTSSVALPIRKSKFVN